jgi:hypothetical protein
MPFTDQQLTVTIDDLESIRYVLGKRVAAEMYQDPFWNDRYGQRGLEHTRQDLEYNFNYLITAIRTDSLEVLWRYYGWLRDLLVLRGMCTRHVWQTIHCTEKHLQQLLPTGTWNLISTFAQAGYKGLCYSNPAAVSLETRAQEICGKAVQARASDSNKKNDSQENIEEFFVYLAYTADAVERDDPSGLIGYLSWKATFLRRASSQEGSAESIAQDFFALSDAVSGVISTENISPIAKVLEAVTRSPSISA